MTTGQLFIIGFGFAVGIFALLAFHLKHDSSSKNNSKNINKA